MTASRAHAVLVATPDKEACQKCPGVCMRGSVQYRTHGLGPCVVQPRAMAKTLKLEPKASTAVHIRYTTEVQLHDGGAVEGGQEEPAVGVPHLSGTAPTPCDGFVELRNCANAVGAQGMICTE